MISLDVSSINTAQTILLNQLTAGFALFVIYAKRLLYYFIAFEIVLSGLAWALYQNQYAERLFFQILKIGLILFIVENYTYLINTLIDSMTMIGHQLSHTDTQKFLLNPGIIWQYGYNFALGLLQTAATAEGFATPLILTILGFGILFVIGIFGIQIFLYVVGFYLISLVSLLSIPLSVFTPLKDFFSKSIKTILQASIKLMVQILLVSAALSVWSQMKLQNFDMSMGINPPLGFFFTGLLFVFASAYLPRLAAKVIGNIESQTSTAGNVGYQSHTTSANAPNQSQLYNTSSPVAYISNSLPVMTQLNTSITNPSLTKTLLVSNKEAFKDQLKTSGITFHTNKLQDPQHQQEVKKIKEAFYEVLTEIKNQEKEENNTQYL